jgi:hypothetical protein
MTTAAPSTALVTIQPAFTDPERLALAGFLAGYRGKAQTIVQSWTFSEGSSRWPPASTATRRFRTLRSDQLAALGARTARYARMSLVARRRAGRSDVGVQRADDPAGRIAVLLPKPGLT